MKKVVAFVLLFGCSAVPLCADENLEPDVQGFRTSVVPFFEQHCIECHSAESKKGDLTLHDIDPNILRGRDLEKWRLVEERVRFGEMPPKYAEQPKTEGRQLALAWIRQEMLKSQQPGTVPDKKLLLPQFGNYVDHRALFGERRSHVVPAPPRIWRLRPAIYDALAPRLGENIQGLANALNSLDSPEFEDYSAPYFLDEASTLQLLGNAKRIAEAQLGPKSKDRVFKHLVDDADPPSEKVVSEGIETGFRKALGRGPTDEELQRFTKLYTQSVRLADYKVAAKALLTAILMQPEFLFRQELGQGEPDKFGRVRLSPREIGFALSYALDNRPLDEFVNAADDGKLATAEQVASAVRKRLEDDSNDYAKNARIMQFFREYFHYPFANEVFKDQPEGGEHKASTLVADLEMTLAEILRRDQNVLAELLTTRRYYVNTGYGRKKEADKLVKRDSKSRKYQTAFSLPLDWKWSARLQPVEFPEDERAGVLTHPAWLAAWSGNFDNHPVQRGKWVRTHLLGGTVPDVPIGVDARVPEVENTTFRDRLHMATRKAECRRCHKKMDPLGVTFERYDHYGRFQRLDAGQPVVTTGVITHTGVPELDGRTVSGPVELMEVLAKSEYVEQVFVRHVFRYFLGRNETLGDANTLQNAHRAYRRSGGSFNALVASLLSSDSFLYRQPSAPVQE